MKAAEVLSDLAEFLESHGIEDSAFEAEQLLGVVLKIVPPLFRVHNLELPDRVLNELQVLAERRVSGYPLQYILGEWEFFGLPFSVGEGVLIPRADTEILVETALKFINDRPNLKIIDLCSGSGCIAVALEKNTKECTVLALEKEDAAYEYLKENVHLNHSLVIPLKGDVMTPFGDDYDLIVSNPPYITPEAMENLQREVTYEPETALRGGEDGLFFYREIIKRWAPILGRGGMLAVEIGFDQKDAVMDIFKNGGLSEIKCVKDYGGNDRVVTGIKP